MNSISWKEILKAVVTFALIALTIAGAAALFVRLASSAIGEAFAALSSLDAAIVVALITGCVSIVSVVLGAIANNRMTYLQKRNEYLRDHREEAYSKLISIFTKIQKGLKTSEEYSEAELLDDMYAFHESLMLWGSSKAIKMWAEWRNAVSKSPSPQELLLAQEAIIIQLRKDMGQKGGLQKGDILKLFINDVDEAVLGK